MSQKGSVFWIQWWIQDFPWGGMGTPIFERGGMPTEADPGGRRLGPPTPVKTSQKRWPPRGATSFTSHRPPSDKFLDPPLAHLT